MKKNVLKRCLPILLVVVIMLSFICSANVFAADSKVVTQTNSYYYQTPPSSIPYDDGTYSGTLYLVSIVDKDIPYLSHPVFFATYTGTVYEYRY